MRTRWICWSSARWKQLMRCPRKSMGRLCLVYLCWIIGAHGWAADHVSRLPPVIAEALARAALPESSVGIYVQDVQSSRPLLAFGEDRPLNPASTIKLLTTFAALDQLGPAYQWSTQIYTDGQFQGDTLNGNLIIKGYGDPRLTLENFWLMLRNLRARGVREIKGDLLLDRTYFAPIDIDP